MAGKSYQQTVIRQPIATITWTAAQTYTIKVPQGFVLREIYINLQCQPTITAGNNTAANTNRFDAWGLVKNIRLYSNYSIDIRNAPAGDMIWMQYFLGGRLPRQTATLGDATTANPSIDTTMIIPLALPRQIRPFDTALPTRNLSSLNMDIQLGTFTDINSAATAWTSAPVLQIHGLWSYGEDPATQFVDCRIPVIQQSVLAGNDQKLTNGLPITPRYRGILLNTTNAAVTVDTVNIVSNWKVATQGQTYVDITDEILRDVDPMRNNLQGYDVAAGVQLAPFRSSNSNVNAWGFIDFCPDGMLSESLNTLGFSQFDLIYNGANTGAFRVQPIQLYAGQG